MNRYTLYARLLPVVLVGLLAYVAVWVWTAPDAYGDGGVLTVAFLDVGQGDAIFIEAPNGGQLLIDGGKGGAVLSALGEMLAFGDHSIDVVLATHPDLDHIGGLPEVFARYEIGAFVEPGVQDDGADYAALLHAVEVEGLDVTLARAGMTIDLGQGVVFEVLFPDRDASGFEANTGGIVGRLTYGETTFLFTGDSPIAIEEYLTSLHGTDLQSDVLKLGHHGSRTSTSDTWIGFVQPEYAIISAGCDNTYGHPHQEVLDRLERFRVEALQTCTDGAVVFESDGNMLTKI